MYRVTGISDRGRKNCFALLPPDPNTHYIRRFTELCRLVFKIVPIIIRVNIRLEFNFGRNFGLQHGLFWNRINP